MDEHQITRDAQGHFLPGFSARLGVPVTKKGHRLTDLVKQRFGDDIEVYIDKTLTRKQRKEIMADALAQLISTGEIRLPDRPDPDEPGGIIKGKVFKYNSAEYMRQMIRILRYIEPPVQEMVISPGGVEGVVFDNEFLDTVEPPLLEEGEENDDD